MSEHGCCKCLVKEEGTKLLSVALCVAEKSGSDQGTHQDVHGFINPAQAPCGTAQSNEKEKAQCLHGHVGKAAKYIVSWRGKASCRTTIMVYP